MNDSALNLGMDVYPYEIMSLMFSGRMLKKEYLGKMKLIFLGFGRDLHSDFRSGGTLPYRRINWRHL